MATICIDYDGTFTEIPDLLTQFIKAAQSAGHRVICATLRYEQEGKKVKASIGQLCEVIFTGRMAKEDFLKDLGIVVDIWVDDQPFWIYRGSLKEAPEMDKTRHIMDTFVEYCLYLCAIPFFVIWQLVELKHWAVVKTAKVVDLLHEQY